MWIVCGLILVASIVCFFMGYMFKGNTEPGTKMKIAITAAIVVLFGLLGLGAGQDAERSAAGVIARDGSETPLEELEIYETLGAIPLSEGKGRETRRSRSSAAARATCAPTSSSRPRPRFSKWSGSRAKHAPFNRSASRRASSDQRGPPRDPFYYPYLICAVPHRNHKRRRGLQLSERIGNVRGDPLTKCAGSHIYVMSELELSSWSGFRGEQRIYPHPA